VDEFFSVDDDRKGAADEGRDNEGRDEREAVTEQSTLCHTVGHGHVLPI